MRPRLPKLHDPTRSPPQVEHERIHFEPRNTNGPGAGCRVAVVDNRDSFTFNLVQYLLELSASVQVFDGLVSRAQDIAGSGATHLLLSPGPGHPDEWPLNLELAREAVQKPKIPLLGVCLGHQALCRSFGARVVAAERVVHGKVWQIDHRGVGPFAGLPSPERATRYHSLVVDPGSLPDFLIPIAHTPSRELMAVAHRELPIYGLQFHPESIATEHGHALLANFLQSNLRAAPPNLPENPS